MTIACAHRGDSSKFTENTPLAIKSALEAGAQYIEIDIRLTSDGEVVVLHDETLERIWGIPRNINEVLWDEVQQLGHGERRIPLLSEVLEYFVGTSSTLLIDMDLPDPAAAAVALVKQSNAKVAWCGDLHGMEIVRSFDPAAEIWLPWDTREFPTAQDIAALKPTFINSHYSYISQPMVAAIHELGCKVAVWTVDNEPTMRWASAIKVDSVTTNQLAMLQNVITTSDVKPATELDLTKAIDVARTLGVWAADVMRYMEPGIVDTKENPADLVTEIDVAIERHVREVVAANFAGHCFVGEEMGGEAAVGALCWYLDPVDGTTNFANRLPWNAFSLALLVDRTPLVAVVADPWRNEIFEAVKDQGAYLNGKRLIVHSKPSDDPIRGKVVSTELAAYVPWPGMLELLDLLARRYCTMRIMGSGTMSLLNVAANRGSGCIIGTFGPVDHLAAALIVKEAGGVVLDENGDENLFPASGGILSGTVHSAPELYKLWMQAIKK